MRRAIKAFDKAFEEAWNNGRLPVLGQILLGMFLFLAGVVSSHVLQGGIEELTSEPSGAAWFVVVSLFVGAVFFTIALISLHGSLWQTLDQERDHHAEAVRAGKRYQAELHDQINLLAERFGLEAQFIREENGNTYRETTELIHRAKKSLVFVDYWVPSEEYAKKAAAGSRDRDAYYQAIVEFVQRQVGADHGGEVHQPHRRIIQLRKGDSPESLRDDDAYYNHLCKCWQFQKDDSAATEVAIVQPLFHSHFAIIDGKRVVQTLMQFQEDGPQRYAAVIYHDERGKLVERYMEMVTRLMSSRLTVFEREIGGGEASSAA